MPCCKVMIIEDEQNLARIFSLALQSSDFEIEIIGDGQVALTQLAESVPDVVILDLNLPYVSGIQVLRTIRADSRLADTRVIVATADAWRAETVREEADLVLLKPISPSQLRDLANRLLKVKLMAS